MVHNFSTKHTFSNILLVSFIAVSVAAFQDPIPAGQRVRFNYSSRPSPVLQQNPVRNRVPDFSLIDENDEEPTTKFPVELSFAHQFSNLGSGLDKKNEASNVVSPTSSKPEASESTDKSPSEGEEEDNSNEDNESRRLRKDLNVVQLVEHDDEPSTTPVINPIPPFGYHFYHVSSKLNAPKDVEVETVDEQQPVEEEKKKTEKNKVEENSEEDLVDEEDDNSEEKKESIPNDSNSQDSRLGRANKYGKFSNLRSAVGCGYYRMRNGHIISVQSSNFNFSEYRNNELCSWRFFGHHCVIRTFCPCFDIPPSSNCQEDHLKITDGYTFAQKFCGQIRPQGTYKSTTNNLMMWFKSDWRDSATGVFCYVICTGPGQPEPLTPPVVCPTTQGPTFSTSTVSSSGAPGEVIITPPNTPLPPGCKIDPGTIGVIPIAPAPPPDGCPPRYRRRISG